MIFFPMVLAPALNKMCDNYCSSIVKYQYSTQYVG